MDGYSGYSATSPYPGRCGFPSGDEISRLLFQDPDYNESSLEQTNLSRNDTTPMSKEVPNLETWGMSPDENDILQYLQFPGEDYDGPLTLADALNTPPYESEDFSNTLPELVTAESPSCKQSTGVNGLGSDETKKEFSTLMHDMMSGMDHPADNMSSSGVNMQVNNEYEMKFSEPVENVVSEVEYPTPEPSSVGVSMPTDNESEMESMNQMHNPVNVIDYPKHESSDRESNMVLSDVLHHLLSRTDYPHHEQPSLAVNMPANDGLRNNLEPEINYQSLEQSLMGVEYSNVTNNPSPEMNYATHEQSSRGVDMTSNNTGSKLEYTEPMHNPGVEYETHVVSPISCIMPTNESNLEYSNALHIVRSGMLCRTRVVQSVGDNMHTLNQDPSPVAVRRTFRNASREQSSDQDPLPLGRRPTFRHASRDQNCGQQFSRDTMHPYARNAKQETRFPCSTFHMNVQDMNHTGLPSDGSDMHFSSPKESSFCGSETNKPNGLASDDKFLDCSGCSLMREIHHSDGILTKRLVLHGEGTAIYHAVMDRERIIQGNHRIWDRQYVNLQDQSWEYIKQFIDDYGFRRQHEGFYVTRDCLPDFIAALCTPMRCNEPAMSIPETPSEPDFGETSTSLTDQSLCLPIRKTGIAAQRERTGKLHIRDLAPYFNSPIENAAKKLNLCVTVIKKICRKYGIERWPFRKIKGIDRKVLKLQKKLLNGDDTVTLPAEIERLQDERLHIYDCCGPLAAELAAESLKYGSHRS